MSKCFQEEELFSLLPQPRRPLRPWNAGGTVAGVRSEDGLGKPAPPFCLANLHSLDSVQVQGSQTPNSFGGDFIPAWSGTMRSLLRSPG